MKFHLEYQENGGILWLHYNGQKYWLSQTSGELEAVDGMKLDDLYWKDHTSGVDVRKIFQQIAKEFSEPTNIEE